MRLRVRKKRLEKIKNYCLEGLMIDGGHHKQWYLAEILRHLCFILDEEYNSLLEEYGFDEGITP